MELPQGTTLQPVCSAPPGKQQLLATSGPSGHYQQRTRTLRPSRLRSSNSGSPAHRKKVQTSFATCDMVAGVPVKEQTQVTSSPVKEKASCHPQAHSPSSYSRISL